MERNRIRRSVTSGIKLKPLGRSDECTNPRKMERATSVVAMDAPGRSSAKTRSSLPFPMIRNQNPSTKKRISPPTQDTRETPSLVDAGSMLRNLPHLDLEDRENLRSSTKTTSTTGRSNDRGQAFPTILVNQQTSISTSEVLEDLSLSSTAFSEVLHHFRDDRQLTISTHITPVRGRQARRCTSQSAWKRILTISHSRVLRIIPPIASPPGDDGEDLSEQEPQESRSSFQSVIKEGNGSRKTTTASS